MAADTDKLEIVSVKSTVPTAPDGGDKVVLSEYNASHPGNGWAFIAGPTPVQVARTPEVERVLRDGTAVLVTASGKEKAASTTDAGSTGTKG